MYQKLSPQPFGFEPLSDRRNVDGVCSVQKFVAKAFRLRALFGLTRSQEPLKASIMSRQSLSASSPFRTLSERSLFLPKGGVAKAFRLRALVGLC